MSSPNNSNLSEELTLTLPFYTNLSQAVQKKFGTAYFDLISQSLDARRANKGRVPQITYVIRLRPPQNFITSSFSVSNIPNIANSILPPLIPLKREQYPLIIGMGPAGLFCALRLRERGIPSVILDRGGPAVQRMKSIAKFWRYGELDPNNNVCFGEGGAGLYSDGKLITRIKSPWVEHCLKWLVSMGAPETILSHHNPHIGSNKIRSLITRLTSFLQSKGILFFYDTLVEELLVSQVSEVSQASQQASQRNTCQGIVDSKGKNWFSPYTILATGHSAKELYHSLVRQEVALSSKDFAVGLRAEHPKHLIDRSQLGDFAKYPQLQGQRYTLKYYDPSEKLGTYSFCMCPGGSVLSSGTHKDHLVSNGMSNSGLNSYWSNAAIVTTVTSEFLKENFSLPPKAPEVLRGLYFQESIEHEAFLWSKAQGIKKNGQELPALSIKDFLEERSLNSSSVLPPSSCPSKIFKAPLYNLFPDLLRSQLQQALTSFEDKISHFTKGILIGPETKTSAPVTLERNKETRESLSHKGLFPCGEGAGYAGGITSAAVDGIKTAEAIANTILLDYP